MSDGSQEPSSDNQTVDSQTVEDQGPIIRALTKVAEVGNRLPDPLTFFVLLTMAVVGASVLFDGASAEVVQRSGEVETNII